MSSDVCSRAEIGNAGRASYVPTIKYFMFLCKILTALCFGQRMEMGNKTIAAGNLVFLLQFEGRCLPVA